MTKPISIILMFTMTFVVNAQNRLSGNLGPYSKGWNCFTNLSWEVNYEFVKRKDGIYLRYFNSNVSVTPNSLYGSSQKKYSKSDLGLSVWPQSYSSTSLNVNTTVKRPDGRVELSGFAISSGNTDDMHEKYICPTAVNGKTVDVSDFTVSVTKAFYNPQSVAELDAIINKKKPSRSYDSSTSTELNDKVSSSSISKDYADSSLETKTEVTTSSYQYTPTYTKKDMTNDIVAAAAPVVTELVDQWNANYEKRLEREKNNRLSAYQEILKRDEEKFKKVYLPLIEYAESGNEHARLILYFASITLNSQHLVPEGQIWFNKAVARNNVDALLFENFDLLAAKKIDDEEYLSQLKKIAELGGDEALVKIAGFYNWKKTGDPKKALEYYNKAAEKGSPIALYYLGMIHKYGCTNPEIKRLYISYKNNIVIDEKIAFEYFKKALQPNYELSIFMRSSSIGVSYMSTSVYNSVKGSYAELAKIYKEGKVVLQDKLKAEEYELLQNTGLDMISKQKFGYQE